MKAAFAGLVGVAGGLLAATAPAANGAVLLIGLAIGVVLSLVVWSSSNTYLPDEEDMA